MDEFQKISIDMSKFQDMEERIDNFKRKATDLCEYVSSQEWGRHSININRKDQNKPTITGSLPNELLLESLYRRFRFFILNDEKTNYFRLIKMLSQSSTSPLIHRFTKVSKKEFFNEDSLQFAFITAETKYSAKEVIEFWFNSYYFHDQDEDRNKLQNFENIVSSNGAKVVLFHAVWNAVRKVRNLNYLLRDTSIKNQKMYIHTLCKI